MMIRLKVIDLLEKREETKYWNGSNWELATKTLTT
jgi:hypothetical protein